MSVLIGTRIPVAGPWVTEREVRYVAEAAGNDWYGHAGESLRRFELAFAESVGVRYAIGVPHCTAALHLAMLAFGSWARRRSDRAGSHLGGDRRADLLRWRDAGLRRRGPHDVVRDRGIDLAKHHGADKGDHRRGPLRRHP